MGVLPARDGCTEYQHRNRHARIAFRFHLVDVMASPNTALFAQCPMPWSPAVHRNTDTQLTVEVLQVTESVQVAHLLGGI